MPQQVVSGEPGVFDILRLWSQGLKEAAKGLTSPGPGPRECQFRECPLNSCSDVEQKKLFFLMKEIIYPDLYLVAKKAISLPKWKELFAIKNTFK